jgi:hypothetical protein
MINDNLLIAAVHPSSFNELERAYHDFERLQQKLMHHLFTRKRPVNKL